MCVCTYPSYILHFGFCFLWPLLLYQNQGRIWIQKRSHFPFFWGLNKYMLDQRLLMFKYHLKTPRHSPKLFLIFQLTNIVFALHLSTIWLTIEKNLPYLPSHVLVTVFSRLFNDLKVLFTLTHHVFINEMAILQHIQSKGQIRNFLKWHILMLNLILIC